MNIFQVSARDNATPLFTVVACCPVHAAAACLTYLVQKQLEQTAARVDMFSTDKLDEKERSRDSATQIVGISGKENCADLSDVRNGALFSVRVWVQFAAVRVTLSSTSIYQVARSINVLLDLMAYIWPRQGIPSRANLHAAVSAAAMVNSYAGRSRMNAAKVAFKEVLLEYSAALAVIL